MVADLPPPAALQEYFEKFRRHVYVTPKSYLSFISGYKGLYQKKLVFVQELARSINSGLAKMGDAKVDVNKMKVRRRSCNCWLVKETHTPALPSSHVIIPAAVHMMRYTGFSIFAQLSDKDMNGALLLTL